MRWAETLVAVAMLAALSSPALAEPRWLGCKYADGRGATHNFFIMFDDLRGTASVLEDGRLVEGNSTSITFQALSTRFPAYALTYNRNDGALSVTPTQGGGLLKGECRRTVPPAGAPRP